MCIFYLLFMEKALLSASSIQSAYWDPAYGELTEEEVAQCSRMRTEFGKKFEYYRNNPDKIRRNLALCFLLTAFILLWACALTRGTLSFDTIQLYLLTFIPPILYYFSVKRLEKQLTKALLAEKEGWLYDPNGSTMRWEVMKTAFADIFHKGDHGQTVYDQFWGRFRDQAPFWAAKFQYTIGYGKNSRTYTEAVYAFRLPDPAAHSLVLRPQNFLRKLENKLEMGLTTESNDFNGLFHIDFEGKPAEVGTEVFQVLSPDAQEKLIEMRKGIGEYTLLFQGDVMVISFMNRENSFAHYTNFFDKVELDQRDVEYMSAKMDSIMGLADAILPCIG